MTDDFPQFSDQLDRIGLYLMADTERAFKRAFLAVDTALVLASPVDEGTFRSNWLPTIGTPSTATRAAFAPGKGGSTGSANSRAALAAAEGLSRRMRLGQTGWVSNNLPYGPVLNDGSSQQAPAGFVQSAVRAGVAAVNGARILSL